MNISLYVRHQTGLFMHYLGCLMYYNCPQSPLLYSKMWFASQISLVKIVICDV